MPSTVALVQIFNLDGQLPGLNDLLAAAKAGRGRSNQYARVKRAETDRIAWLVRAARLRPVPSVRMTFAWRELARRRDPDNFCAGGRKLILDALVKAGVLKNDGWGQVLSWSDTWTVDLRRPGVEVTLTTDLPLGAGELAKGANESGDRRRQRRSLMDDAPARAVGRAAVALP